MTNFDLKKAILEEIEGLQSVQKAINQLIRDSQEKIGEAEISLNAALKTEGFLKLELERKQAVLRELMRKEKEGE